VLPVGILIGDLASGAGLVATCIAVCGFLMQVRPALAREDDRSVRVATVAGGIVGLLVAALVIAAGLLIG
jgi:hypothetical protein